MTAVCSTTMSFTSDDVKQKFAGESVGTLGRANENRGIKDDSH